jgi:ribosome modulation factor
METFQESMARQGAKQFKGLVEVAKSSAYDKGYRAAVSAVDHDENPYKASSKEYKAWNTGWDAGKRDNEQ